MCARGFVVVVVTVLVIVHRRLNVVHLHFSNALFTSSRGASLVLRHCGVLSIGGCRRHALSDFYSLLEVVAGSRSLEKCVPSLEMWWQRSHQ